jgi:tRNA pseudouridine13 synthase
VPSRKRCELRARANRQTSSPLPPRQLSEPELRCAIDEVAAASRDGIPNYFDDQRFGSIGFSGEFIGHAWLLGNYARALELALAEPNPFDRSQVKAQKAKIREYWGRWAELKTRLERSSARSIVTYLVDHPTDYRGAFARLRRELRTLYFSAFQSHLWNLIVGQWIERMTTSDHRVSIDLKAGVFPFPRFLGREERDALIQALVPLPSSRTPAPAGPLGDVIALVLDPFRLSWSDLKVRHLKDVFFSKGSRACLVFPERLEHSSLKDELHGGRWGLRLSFELPKGSYATILVKRITEVADSPK